MNPNSHDPEVRLSRELETLLPELLEYATRPVTPGDSARLRELVREVGEQQAKAADADREYIEQWADDIYVREQVDGKWGTYALSELPPKLAMRHAMRR